MRTVWSVLALAGFLALWGSGCRSTRVHPSASLPPLLPAGGAASLAEPQIVEGRNLYIAKCARCHQFYSPANYPEAEWHRWMTKMSRKAKLDSVQKDVLLRYLGAFRSGFGVGQFTNTAVR